MATTEYIVGLKQAIIACESELTCVELQYTKGSINYSIASEAINNCIALIMDEIIMSSN